MRFSFKISGLQNALEGGADAAGALQRDELLKHLQFTGALDLKFEGNQVYSRGMQMLRELCEWWPSENI